MTVHLTSGYDYIYEDTTYLMKSQPLHERLLHHIETGNIESAMRAAKLLWKDVNIEKESDEEHFNKLKGHPHVQKRYSLYNIVRHGFLPPIERYDSIGYPRHVSCLER